MIAGLTAAWTFISNKVTQALVLVGLGLVFVWRIYAAGKADERAAKVEEDLKAANERLKTNDRVSQMSDTDRRDRLNRWVSDDNK